MDNNNNNNFHHQLLTNDDDHHGEDGVDHNADAAAAAADDDDNGGGEDNPPLSPSPPPWFNELKQTGRLGLLSIIIKNRCSTTTTSGSDKQHRRTKDAITDGKLLKIHFDNGLNQSGQSGTTRAKTWATTTTTKHQATNDDDDDDFICSTAGSRSDGETPIPVVKDDGSMMIVSSPWIRSKHDQYHPPSRRASSSSSSSSSLPGEPKSNHVNHPNDDDENVQIRKTEQVFEDHSLLPRKHDEEEKEEEEEETKENVAAVVASKKSSIVNPDMTTVVGVVGHGLSSTTNNNHNNNNNEDDDYQQRRGKNLEAEVNSRHYHHHHYDDHGGNHDDGEQQQQQQREREQEQQRERRRERQPRNHHSTTNTTIETKLADKDSRQQQEQRQQQQRRSPRQQQQQQLQPQKPTIYDNNNNGNNNPGNNDNDNNNDDDDQQQQDDNNNLVGFVVANTLVDDWSTSTSSSSSSSKIIELQRNYIHSFEIEHICQADHQQQRSSRSDRDIFLDRSTTNKNDVLNDHHRRGGDSNGCCSTLNNDPNHHSANCCCCWDIEKRRRHSTSDNCDGDQIRMINGCFNHGDNFDLKQRQQGSLDYHWPSSSLIREEDENENKTTTTADTAASSSSSLSSEVAVAETNLKHPQSSSSDYYIIQFVSFECGQCVFDKYRRRGCLNGSTRSSSSSSSSSSVNHHQQQQQQLNHLQQQQQQQRHLLQNVDPVGSLESSSEKFSIIKFKLINNKNNNNYCCNNNHHNNNHNHPHRASIDGTTATTVFQDTIGHCDHDDDDDGKLHWIQCDLNEVYERFIIVATTTTTTTDANVTGGQQQQQQLLLPFVCIDCRRPVSLSATNDLIVIPPIATKAQRRQQSTIINLCEKHCVHLLTLSIIDGYVDGVVVVPSDSVIQQQKIAINHPKMVVQQTLNQPQPPHRHYLRNGNTNGTINRYNGRQTVSTTSLNTVATNGNHHHHHNHHNHNHHHHHKTTNIQNGTGGGPFIPKRPSSVSSSNSNESNKDLSSSTDCSLDTDSSGDYEYGPGIVDRLRHKFMALSSKHHPTSSSTTSITTTNGHYRFGQQKKCLSSVDVSTLIKRCSSMEELTFKQQLKQCGNNQQKLPPSSKQHRTSATKPSLYNGHQMVNGAKKKLMHHMSAGVAATTNGHNGSGVVVPKKLPPPPLPPPLPKSLPPDDDADNNNNDPAPQYPKGIVQKLIQQQQQQPPKQPTIPSTSPKSSTTKTSESSASNNNLTDSNITTLDTVAADLQLPTIQSTTTTTATSNNLIDQHPHHLHLDGGCGESMMNGGEGDCKSNKLANDIRCDDSVHPGDSGSLLKPTTTPQQLNHNLVINKNSGSQNLLLLATPKPYMKRSKSVETLSLFANSKFSTLNNCLAATTTPTTSNDDNGGVVVPPQSEQSETNPIKQEDSKSSNYIGTDQTIPASQQQSLDIRLESDQSETLINIDIEHRTSPSSSLMVQCDSAIAATKVLDAEALASEDHNNQCNNKCFNNNNTRDSHNDKSTLRHFEVEAEDTLAATKASNKGSEEQQVALAVVHNDIVVGDDDEGNCNMEQHQQQQQQRLEAKEDQHRSSTIITSIQLKEEEPPTTLTPLINNVEEWANEKVPSREEVNLVQYANNADVSNKDVDFNLVHSSTPSPPPPSSSSSTPTATSLLSGDAVKVIDGEKSSIDPKSSAKMIVTNELPKPDTVKTVKKIFESNTGSETTRKSSPDSAITMEHPAKQQQQQQHTQPQQKLQQKPKPTKSLVNTDRPTHRYRPTVPKSSSSSTSSTTGRRPPPPPIPPPMAPRLQRGTLTKDQTESNNRTSGTRSSRPLVAGSTSLHSSSKHYQAPKPPQMASSVLSNGVPDVPKPEPAVCVENKKQHPEAIDNNTTIINNETSGVKSSKITPNNIIGGANDDNDDDDVGLVVENVANNDKSFPLNGIMSNNAAMMLANKNDTDGDDDNNNNTSNDSKIDSNNMMILIKNNNHDPSLMVENVGHQKPVCHLRTFNCSPTPSPSPSKECLADNDHRHELQQISLSKTTPTTTTPPPTLSAEHHSPPPPPSSTLSSVLNATKTTANSQRSVSSLANTINHNKFPRPSSTVCSNETKDSKKMNVKKEEEQEKEEEPIKTLKPSILQPQQRSSNTKSTLWSAKNLESSTPKLAKIGSTSLNGGGTSAGGGGSSIVFDFRDNKNVKPNIAIQPTPYGSKPIPKRIMKEIRSKSGASESEDDDDDDDDDDEDYGFGGTLEMPQLPCGIIFEGENIVINLGSLLHRRNKNLSIKFNDSGVSIFEYPPELTDDDDEDDDDGGVGGDEDSDDEQQHAKSDNPVKKVVQQPSSSSLSQNSVSNLVNSITATFGSTSSSPSSASASSPVVINGHASNVLNKKSFAIGSSNLASYKPSKVEESRFELGVTKTKNDFQKKTNPMNNHHHHQPQQQQQHQNHHQQQQQPNRFIQTSKQSDDEDCDNATMMNTMIKPASIEDTVTFSQSSTASDLLF